MRLTLPNKAEEIHFVSSDVCIYTAMIVYHVVENQAGTMANMHTKAQHAHCERH